MGYELKGRGSIPGRGEKYFDTPQRPDRMRSQPKLLFNGYRELPLKVKRPGREADHLPSSSAEVMNVRDVPPGFQLSTVTTFLTSRPWLLRNYDYPCWLLSASPRCILPSIAWPFVGWTQIKTCIYSLFMLSIVRRNFRWFDTPSEESYRTVTFINSGVIS
jgi:hypothetical protein